MSTLALPVETAVASAGTSVAVVTGGSAGLGKVIARRLLDEGYAVVVVGRNQERLAGFVAELPKPLQGRVLTVVCDVCQPSQVSNLVDRTLAHWGQVDVLVNVVGQSDRGFVQHLTADQVNLLIRTNVIATLVCCQAFLPLLQTQRGVIVNIGSLAAKVGARYLGGYAAAKHALAAITQQMRLEWKSRGVHVGLINPGPIRREDAGNRYASVVAQHEGLPASAAAPGGGTRVKGLPPQRVASAVMRMIRKRSADIILPWYLRPLVAVGHLWPALGDWLLLKLTSRSSSGD